MRVVYCKRSAAAELAALSKKGRRRARRPAGEAAVRRLFDACREIFADGGSGFVPPPGDVARLRSILDSMGPADVGLTESAPYIRNINVRGPPQITYLHLYESNKFSIGIFCLPPSAVIPLHNHPGMTVFSKILYGSMHIKSYDWVELSQMPNEPSRTQNAPPEGVRLAKLKTNAVFTSPCETSILYPADGGNMHCFTGETACAVLDVVGPPYSDLDGRPCTYYKELPYEQFSSVPGLVPQEGEVFAWLKERRKPEECVVLAAPYNGPKFAS